MYDFMMNSLIVDQLSNSINTQSFETLYIRWCLRQSLLETQKYLLIHNQHFSGNIWPSRTTCNQYGVIFHHFKKHKDMLLKFKIILSAKTVKNMKNELSKRAILCSKIYMGRYSDSYSWDHSQSFKKICLGLLKIKQVPVSTEKTSVLWLIRRMHRIEF